MKALIKATGEIVEVVITQRKTHTGEQVYMTDDSRLIEESGLELNVDDTPDYWTRLEHTYAGMAMQGILSGNSIMERIAKFKVEDLPSLVADLSIQCAHALVEKMKEERK